MTLGQTLAQKLNEHLACWSADCVNDFLTVSM